MKKHLIILLLFLISNFVKGQFCSQTTLVNMGNITPTGVNQSVTGAASAKRYWTFTATAGCTYTLSTCTSVNTNDTYLRLYSGTNPASAVLVTSNDDNGPICAGNKASIVWTCPTSGAYSILVTNYSCANLSASTNLVFRVVCGAPVYNPCSGTYPTITCGNNVNWTVASGNGAYNPPSITCGFSTPGQEKIYVFTPTVTGTYTLNQLSSFGFIDYFFKPVSSGCSGTGWTCIDDLIGASSSVGFNLTANVQYYIMLDPETTGGGSLSFRILCPSAVVVTPSNDNCSSAFNISSVPFTSSVTTTNNSTNDIPTSLSNCGTMGSNLWYTVTGNGTTYTATTCNGSTNYDTEVRVYTGSCVSLNSMVEVICNDDDGVCISGTTKSTVSWCAEAGVVYYITVGYFSTGPTFGNFVLNVSSGTPCQLLPIELLTFTGINKKDHNNITWVTATETNNNYFTLERSLDAFDWDIVTTKKGNGTTSLPSFYEYNDYNFIKGKINYYRLSQTDFDGGKEYFNIIAIQSKEDYKCELYQYYDLLGREINIENVPSGMYLRKCGEKIEKVIK